MMMITDDVNSAVDYPLFDVAAMPPFASRAWMIYARAISMKFQQYTCSYYYNAGY